MLFGADVPLKAIGTSEVNLSRRTPAFSKLVLPVGHNGAVPLKRS